MIGNITLGNCKKQESTNKLVTIGLNNLGVSNFEEVTYEMLSDYINSLAIIIKKGENYYFEIIEFYQEPTDGFVIIDLTNSPPNPQNSLQVTDLTN